MARMLGTNREAGCGLGRCYYCQRGDETRRTKRIEERRWRRELADEMTLLLTEAAQVRDGYGPLMSAVCLLTGFTPERVNELGGTGEQNGEET